MLRHEKLEITITILLVHSTDLIVKLNYAFIIKWNSIFLVGL